MSKAPLSTFCGNIDLLTSRINCSVCRTSATRPLFFDEYVNHDAKALADLVRKGDVSPAESLETAIARAEAVNLQLNAIVTPLYEKGRAMAANTRLTVRFVEYRFCSKILNRNGLEHPGNRVVGVTRTTFLKPTAK